MIVACQQGRGLTLLLACVLWSVECGNALGQSRVAPVG